VLLFLIIFDCIGVPILRFVACYLVFFVLWLFYFYLLYCFFFIFFYFVLLFVLVMLFVFVVFFFLFFFYPLCCSFILGCDSFYELFNCGFCVILFCFFSVLLNL